MTTKIPVVLCVVLAAAAAGFFVGHSRSPRAAQSRHVLYYVDPMHPSYHSDKPGTAPDCGMQLEPVYAEDSGKIAAAAAPGSIQVNPAAQQLYGIQLAKAELSSGQRDLRVFGQVAADETRVYHVNVGTDGYVKSTQDDAVGNFVKKDQHLAVIYSPEFLAVVGGYLSANERTPGNVPGKESASPNAASAQARADRLRNLGMSDAQIAEVASTRKIPEDTYVVSPTDGFILARNITPGEHFSGHSDFYTIADLSQVWIVAEVYGNDARAFTPGAVARVTLPDTGESFRARVTNVVPEVDPATRGLKIRLQAENPRFALRPQMYVNVELPVRTPSGITVPAGAVLDSGLSKRVFVASGDSSFEPREVQTGESLGDRIQILKGLKEGETVVSAGTFLIDSESRLQMAAASETKPAVESASNRHLN